MKTTSTYSLSASKPNDSKEKQSPSHDKRKSIEISQTPNLIVEAKKPRINPDESSSELKKKPKNFNAEKAAYWEKGERVPFLFMVNTVNQMFNEPDPIVSLDILCNTLRTVIETTPEDLIAFVYLLSKRVLPPHMPIHMDDYFIYAEIEPVIMKFEELSEETTECIVKDFKEELGVVKVYETFKKLAETCPNLVKMDLLRGLFEAATGCEPLHLVHLLRRMLEVGGSHFIMEEEALLIMLGHAAVYSKCLPGDDVDPLKLEEAANILKKVYSWIPSYDKIVPDLLSGGVWKLPETCTITPGIPIEAMLPKKVGSIHEILDKFQDREFICEYEYPGERAMIHYMENGEVEVYGSHGWRITVKYSDVGSEVVRLKKDFVKSFIIDCQLVTYDHDKEEIIPSKFAHMCRGSGISELEVKVCVVASDILYLNGEQLLQKPLTVRREALLQSFQPEAGFLQLSNYVKSNNPEDIGNFIGELESSSSQLIIKTWTEDATYEPGKISENWLKFEEGYVEHISPSLNLVPIAAFPSWMIGSKKDKSYMFVLACYDDNTKEYLPICDIGPPIVHEELLAQHFDRLSKTAIDGKKTSYKCPDIVDEELLARLKTNYNYDAQLFPHACTWFEPTEIWEVHAYGLYTSSICQIEYGTVNPIKGIRLLNPYFFGVVRKIGDLHQPTSADKLVEYYEASKRTHLCNF